jgi:hypothetical protein
MAHRALISSGNQRVEEQVSNSVMPISHHSHLRFATTYNAADSNTRRLLPNELATESTSG